MYAAVPVLAIISKFKSGCSSQQVDWVKVWNVRALSRARVVVDTYIGQCAQVPQFGGSHTNFVKTARNPPRKAPATSAAGHT